MSKVRLAVETQTPEAPAAGYGNVYLKNGVACYQLEDGVEHQLIDPSEAVEAHINSLDPHGDHYLTPELAALVYAEINHIHATGNLLQVSKVAGPGQYSTVASAIQAALDLAPSKTNRFVIEVGPGEYLENPGLTVPNYVYLLTKDPWGAAHIKTTDPTQDFITVAPNAGIFNLAVSGPTTPGKSTFIQTASGTIKLYWINIREGYYGVTLNPASGAARCHSIGVVTDGPTQMNRMFNCDNPAGVGIFILMQSGPMVTTWVGPQPTAVYLNGNGSITPYKANATLDICQFRGTGYDAVYVDNGALARGIGVSFAGGNNAIHIGPNGSSKVDFTASQIKQGGWTKDIWSESDQADISFSGVATNAKIDIPVGTNFTASFSDTAQDVKGQVLYGELWIGNLQVRTPLASYIQADKNTGLVTGGELTRGVNPLDLNVAAGEGFVDTLSGLTHVTWGATTITLQPNLFDAQVYVDSSGTVLISETPVDKTSACLLGQIGTNATEITYFACDHVLLPQFRARLSSYLQDVVGPINIAGGSVTPQGLGFDVSASSYYLSEIREDTPDMTGVAFNYWYKNGAGNWTITTNQSALNVANYDNGTGVLATMTDTYWRRDLLFVINHPSGVSFHVVMGQEQFPTEVEATNNPNVPEPLLNNACRLAALIVQKGATTFSVLDQRPRLGQMAAGSSTITNHDDLAGRDSPSAHSQYQLLTAKGQANGYAPLDGTGKVPSENLPAVVHGDLGGGTLHSIATTSAAGFMSAIDKVKLDTINETNVPTTAEKQALAGTSGTAVSQNNPLVDSSDSRLTNDRRSIPQGVDKAVQFKRNGLTEGASEVLIDADDRLLLTTVSGLAEVTSPINGIKTYGRKKAGRSVVEVKGSANLDSGLQHAFFDNKIGLMQPNGNSTAVNFMGINTGSITGTTAPRNVGTANLLSSMRRIGYVPTNPSNGVAGWHEAVAQHFLGNSPKMGGFFVVYRFGLFDLPATARWFVGLDNATSTPTNVDPLTLNNVIGIGCIDSASTIKAWGRGVTNVTPADTGIQGKTDNAVFELRIFAPPNSTKVGMSLERIDTGEYWETEDLGALTGLPAVNILMGLKFWISSNNGVNQGSFDLCSIYKETDY